MRNRLTVFVLVLAAWPVGAARGDTFNIEIDYMVDDDHSHEPSQAVLNAVIQAFACQGHTLNIDLDDAIPHVDVLVRNPNDCDASLFGYDNNTNSSFGQIRQTYFDHENDSDWFYGVFAHRYENSSCSTTGSSGLSNGGRFFIVTMGGFSGQVGTPYDNAGTLMHEFGHNLGLSHCGSQYCGSQTGNADYVGPYVVNMPSTMSYQYQLRGVEANLECQGVSLTESLFKNIDFSHGLMCGINEDSLNEHVGSSMRAVDWDCDGTLEASVAQNTNNSSNGWCGAGGNRTTVVDYNEWGNLSPGVPLSRAVDTGDPADLVAAGYRFVDPTDGEEVRQLATEYLQLNKRPELHDEMMAAVETGDAQWLAGARVLTFDPDDQAQVKRVASAELERRRIENDENPCISAEEHQAQLARGGCAQPTLVTESCISGDNVYVGDEFCIPFPPICISTGSCIFPQPSVLGAQAAHPARSRYYLQPKTYNEAGVVVLNKRGVWTCARTGSAVIK